MIGNKYKLFGTSTIFEITGEDGDYWIIAVSSDSGEQLGVLMKKVDLTDGVQFGKLIQI